jgi:hypothetical protein
MFERQGWRAAMLCMAILAAIGALLLGLAAETVLTGGAEGSGLCLRAGQDLCKLAFEHRYSRFGRFHAVAAHITVQALAVLSLVAMTFFAGRGYREGTRAAMNLATLCGVASLAGAVVGVILAANATFSGGTSVLGCTLCVAMMLASALAGAAIVGLHSFGIPDVWPWVDEYISNREKGVGSAIAGIVLLAVLMGIGFRVQARPGLPDAVASPTSESQIAEILDLPTMLKCDSDMVVRPNVLQSPSLASVPHLAPSMTGAALAMRIDWATADASKPLREWMGPELDAWLRQGNDAMVVNVSSLPCSPAADSSVAPGCVRAATSQCVAKTAPAEWLTWARIPGSGRAQTLDEAATALGAGGLRGAAACLRTLARGGFAEIAQATAGARGIAAFLEADGRCAAGGAPRILCFDGPFGLVIGGSVDRLDASAGASWRGNANETMGLRSCIRQIRQSSSLSGATTVRPAGTPPSVVPSSQPSPPPGASPTPIAPQANPSARIPNDRRRGSTRHPGPQ